MSRQNNLFDLFQTRARQLEERPSSQSWRRLEQRLDTHQRRGRVTMYRSLGMVAGVLALVALIAMISLIVDRRQDALLSQSEGVPKNLENLSVQEADEEVYKVVEFTRTYQDRMTKPIEEGDPAKKLVPAEVVN